MNDKSIKIDDVIIDPAYIIAIDLRAMILPSDGCKHQSGVNITLAAVVGDMEKQTNLILPRLTYQLEYVGSQAEVLRPWLEEMFPCEGRTIRLPEVDTESGEGDGDDDAPKKCQECHEPIEVAVNERFCSDTCNRSYYIKFLAEIPF